MARKKTVSVAEPDDRLAAKFALIFSHPEGIEWYWDEAADEAMRLLPADDPHTFDVIEAMLDHLPALTTRYSPWQVSTGFHFIFSFIATPYTDLFRDERIDESRRSAAAAKLFDLFDRVFRDTASWTHGPAHLLRERPAGADPVQADISTICYMFWDTCRLPHLGVPGVRSACLDVMERCLAVPNHAVQESALHGLGHLAPDNARASALAAGYAARRTAPPELIEYAKAASASHVL